MEVQRPSFRQRPSVEPIKVPMATMAVDGPQEEVRHHHFEAATPIFREPKWSIDGHTPMEDAVRPVPLQPSAREDGMKQHDKDVVARLDRSSTSSASESPTSPDTKLNLPASIEDEGNAEYADIAQQRVHLRPSQAVSAPPQPQPHQQQQRPLHQQRRPAPLTLNPTRPATTHQPHRLPSLTRLVPSGDHQLQHQQVSHGGHRQQLFTRVSKNTINSPSTYGAYTPVQVVPSWQGIPYAWAPVSVPFQVQAPLASPHQVFPAHYHRSNPQQQQQQTQKHSPASTGTPTSTTSTSAPQLREDLWKVGGQYLSNPAAADAYVRAVEIRHGSVVSNSGMTAVREEHMDVDGADGRSPSPLSDVPANPFGNSLLLRIVIHSPGRSSVAMTREFDRRRLRDTIPDFARSPNTPNSGTSTGTAAPTSATVSTPVSAISSMSFARRRKSQIRAQHAGTPTTPVSASPTRRLAMPPVPIHLPFARAHAPALAAVLLLRETHKGDSIDLPMPFPGAWLETSAYMYTGNEELLSERVKQNIWYLGGVPTLSN
ncbi:hypothetical protein NLU13_1492 [Sarocladium strictum]|uniref:Uncharacterized protein n=1 Tax=Sarocladium strictum TaxID=5046 RepID=A0AA39GRU9_SARSR|nr:hypothetical protein NLU13_1492 [Sarocladium strictum]